MSVSMFRKKPKQQLMVKDLMNDLERAECIKTRIEEQLKKDIDRPIQMYPDGTSDRSLSSGSAGFSSGSSGWPSSVMLSSSFSSFPTTALPSNVI